MWYGVVWYGIVRCGMALFESNSWFISHKNDIMDHINEVSNFKQKSLINDYKFCLNFSNYIMTIVNMRLT